MNQKKIIITSIASLLIILIGAFIWYNLTGQDHNKITSYEECAAAGYPIRETYPEQCSIPGGKTYTRDTNSKTSISLAGTTTCLPHKNADGPHTMECAMGIKSDNGKYYGIGSDPYDTALSEVGRRLIVTGTLEQETRSQYNSEGMITVSSYKLLE